jgi:hypothetical protein
MYTNEMAFEQWVAEAGYKGNTLVNAINAGKILYDKWYQMSYGKTDAQIAALPQFAGKTEADISAMAYAVGVFNEMYLALHNGAVAQADRAGYLTPVL